MKKYIREVFRGMFMSTLRLTSTEEKVIREYELGLKPKEIAAKLNISVKTVYKALWKYRKIKGMRGHTREKSPEDSLIKTLIEIRDILLRIDKRIQNLEYSLSELIETFKEEYTIKDTGEELPSFLRDNPWIEILRLRGKEKI